MALGADSGAGVPDHYWRSARHAFGSSQGRYHDPGAPARDQFGRQHRSSAGHHLGGRTSTLSGLCHLQPPEQCFVAPVRPARVGHKCRNSAGPSRRIRQGPRKQPVTRLLTFAWFVAIWLGLAGSVSAQYSIVDLGDLGGGYARARAINGLGQVAGEALLPAAGTVDRAVLWQGASLTDLGTLGGQQSAALGINNSGTICGWAETASGNTVPALWNGGAVTALPTLGGASGTAWGINDAGTAVGYSDLSNGGYHAALWSGGGVQDLGTLGGAYSVAYDINNSGEAVGTASDSAGRDRAVLWGPGGATDLGALSGGQWTAGSGVNESGEVILWGTPLGATENRAAFWNGNPSSPVVSLGTFGGSQS